eukprot:XP_017949984.1 PREDICTED: cytochrome P450 2C31 isoform X2 [Xenopus tropicalis]
MDPVSVLLSVVICIFLYKIFYGGKETPENSPPGPKPLPLIGNLHMINMKKPHLTFMELAEKYGSVYSVKLGTRDVVVLCGTDTVRDALINHAEEFSGRAKIPVFDEVSNGHGKPFDNTMIMNAAVANIIVHILLNHRFEYQDPTLLKLIKIVSENIRIGGSPIVMLYNTYPSIMRWIPGRHKTVGANTAKLYDFLKETFTRHREHLDVNDQRDLIDVFLVKQQEEKLSSTKFFHDENLTVLLGNLFGAGMETTSTTLRWGLLLMMKYPEVQKKVQDDIDRVIGSAEPRLEHRKLMPYTDAVIHEIQRFANIAPTNVPHATTKDVTFRGFFIPKGTQIMPLLTSVLRDKAYFKKPEEFYPEHFLDSDGNFVKNEACLPFSAGKRSCAGETLAKMELFLFFTKLLQNFTFQPPPGVEVQLTCADSMTSTPLCQNICALAHS